MLKKCDICGEWKPCRCWERGNPDVKPQTDEVRPRKDKVAPGEKPKRKDKNVFRSVSR